MNILDNKVVVLNQKYGSEKNNRNCFTKSVNRQKLPAPDDKKNNIAQGADVWRSPVSLAIFEAVVTKDYFLPPFKMASPFVTASKSRNMLYF